MLRSAASKVAWVGRTASMVFGLALVMALVVGVSSAALAGNLDPLKIGSLKNVATKTTQLVGKVATGSAFVVKNPSGGAALDLQVNAGQAPLVANAEAGTATNLSTDKLDGKDSAEFIQRDPSAAQSGSINIEGTLKTSGNLSTGSGTGTSQPPNMTGIIVRRINSTNPTAGQVVARTDQLRLERDGTNGGLRIAWDAQATSVNTVNCMGINNTEAAVNHYSRPVPYPSATSAGTSQIFTDAENVVYATCSFGNSFSTMHITQVTLQRFPTSDDNWVGTVTSTVNQ